LKLNDVSHGIINKRLNFSQKDFLSKLKASVISRLMKGCRGCVASMEKNFHKNLKVDYWSKLSTPSFFGENL
jgi:hypothetical protein